MQGIILAGGKADHSITQIYGDIPTGLIPIYGKPIIFHVIDKIIDLEDVEKITIAVGYKSEKLISFIDAFYRDKIKIQYVHVDYLKKPGNSLLSVLKKLKKGKVIISLADTITELNLAAIQKGDVVFCSEAYEKSELWCTIEIDPKGRVVSFKDKKEIISEDLDALIGLYVLNDISKLTKITWEDINYEISDILKVYNSVCPLQSYQVSDWLDFGHLNKYQKSKKRLLESRSFNTLHFDDLLGTITKKSNHVEKFKAEIKWQLNLPERLKVLSPRILSYNIADSDPYLTMEYYSYQTMAEIWLYSSYGSTVKKNIIKRLFDILMLFKNERRKVSKRSYFLMYKDKTETRLNQLKELNNEVFNLFLEGDSKGYLYINNIKLKSWKLLKEEVSSRVENLYNEEDNCLIHGDFCFSNILYDINSNVVRLIDPRGIWGESENGDIKYDIAKLRHSISGEYDYVVNDLFTLEKISNGIKYQMLNELKNRTTKAFFDELISKQYNLNDIMLIEGLLFLTMVPLHSNKPNRQLIMLSKGIELLNSI